MDRMTIAGKLKFYPDILANVRNDGQYYPIHSLVQVDDPEVREIARVLVRADNFVEAVHEFVNSFTSYRREIGDFWALPSEMLGARAGDCFTGDTPVWIKDGGRARIVEIRELLPIGDYAQYGGVDIFSPSGFVPIFSVSRRHIQSIVRLRTTSDVGLTPSHKLLANPMLHELGKYKVASDILLEQIIHRYPRLEISEVLHSDSEYELGWAYGLFFADGTVSLRKQATLGGESWRLYNSNAEYLERAAAVFRKLYPDMIFPIRLYKSYTQGSQVRSSLFSGERPKSLYCMDALLKIDSSKGIRARFARSFHSMFYNAFGVKRVPESIIHGSVNLAKGFWDGVSAGDGEQEGWRVTSKSKMATLGLAYLLRKLGEEPYVSADHKASRVWARIGGIKQSYRPWRVASQEQEVFDIATANGEVVVGDIAAKNCDDSSILLCSLLRNYIPPEKVFVGFGVWSVDGSQDGHAWVVVQAEDGTDLVLESTAHPRKALRGKYILDAMFNDQYIFATDIGVKDFDLRVPAEEKSNEREVYSVAGETG